jgi:hypothetical protein
MISLKAEKAAGLFSEGITDLEGDPVVGKDPFLKLLKEQSLISDEDALSIAKLCVSDKDPVKVSLKKLDD